MSCVLWVSQRQIEINRRIEFLRVEYLEEALCLLAVPTEDSGMSEALEHLGKAVHHADVQTLQEAQSQLMALGWNREDVESETRKVQKEQSEHFGVSVGFLISDEFQEMAQQRTGLRWMTVYRKLQAVALNPWDPHPAPLVIMQLD